MVPKPLMTPREKIMEVIKKWESDGVFKGEEAGQQKKGEGGPKQQGDLEVPTKGDNKLKDVKRVDVRGNEKKEGLEEEKENDTGKKGVKRKATRQSQSTVVSDTETAAVIDNPAKKRLKRGASSQWKTEQAQETVEKLDLERAGNGGGLKGEGDDLASMFEIIGVTSY